MRYTYRPVGPWAEGDTAARRGAHVFRASWQDTMTLLTRELEYLGADAAVLQIDIVESDLRVDGMPRANARDGKHPGVRVSFHSVHGPLTYATDAYEQQHGHGLKGWQANIRAIALALEALRAVDRYGVTRRGEQYTGWRALPAGTDAGATHMTADDARVLLLVTADRDTPSPAAPAGVWQSIYRAARRNAHPDRNGGSRGQWDLVEQAGRVLGLEG